MTHVDLKDNILFDTHSTPILIISIFIIIISLMIMLFLNPVDNNNIKENINSIIHLNQRITYIKSFIEKYLQTNFALEQFHSKITRETKLTLNQYTLLNFIKELKDLQKEWTRLIQKGFLRNFSISSPYTVAYSIRDILNIEIYVDIEGDDYVWLIDDELTCIANNKQFHTEETTNNKPDHSIINDYIKNKLKNNKITEDDIYYDIDLKNQ